MRKQWRKRVSWLGASLFKKVTLSQTLHPSDSKQTPTLSLNGQKKQDAAPQGL
jgi:hypothetical protein